MTNTDHINEEEKKIDSLTITEEIKIEDIKSEEVKSEIMEREQKPKKSYCSVMKNDVHLCLKCFTYSWAFCLNGIEFCCGSCAGMCMCLGKTASGCKDFLEMIDCDYH